jgi:hypothetical protein
MGGNETWEVSEESPGIVELANGFGVSVTEVASIARLWKDAGCNQNDYLIATRIILIALTGDTNRY